MKTLSTDALLLVAEQLGVQTLPRVLAVEPGHDSYDSWAVAQRHARSGLHADGVLDPHGEVDPDLAEALVTLARPERELSARIYSEGRVTRVSVAYRTPHHAIAVRHGDTYRIGTFWCDGSAPLLAAPLLPVLGTCPPADVDGFTAPATELATRLNAVQQHGEYADALYALGLQAHDATAFGAVFAACRGVAEIVAYAYSDGVAVRAPGAVAVYDGERGRITASPMVSPDQLIWSTVTAGSDHRVTQAVAALVEGLPGGRWLPP